MGYGKIIGIVLVVVIIGAGLGVYYHYSKPAKAPIAPPAEQPALPKVSEEPPKKEAPTVSLPLLNDSDDWFRKQIKTMSIYPKLANWLKVNNLIRRIVSAVDNIAEGINPRPHFAFMVPSKALTVIKKGENLYINPQSYRRYDLIANVFGSLDTNAVVRIYEDARPLFEEAYRELGYPEKDFQGTLKRAIRELLGTPIVEGNIGVEEGVVTYTLVEQDLEDLSDAQKLLLRMGPQNIRKVQKKLREIGLALGIPENQMPKPQVYAIKP